MTQSFLMKTDAERKALGEDLMALMERLYPICRSKTGDGVRETLRIVSEYIPLEVHEVPSGTPAYDWTVPKEWNIREAWIKDPAGRRIVDFEQSNLHVAGYSTPVHQTLPLEELRPHLASLPDHPDWIPYRQAFYRENWEFALRHRDLEKLEDGDYEVFIDSSLEDGHLTYGEAYLPGASKDEILISTHTCHPSLGNDNLSGISIAALLAKKLRDLPRHYSYRFIFIPGTIGSIVWLSRNEDKLARIKHGVVLACLGDPGGFTYYRSRQDDTPVDRAFAHVLDRSGQKYDIKPFVPYGYDQRQFCTPGFDLPIGSLLRTPYGCFPEYHTSADDLTFVKADALAGSLEMVLSGLFILENDRHYFNLSPKGEPHLGRRGLFDKADELGLFWILNLSDGKHSLLDIAERSGMNFNAIKAGAEALAQTDLLKVFESEEPGR